MHCGGENWFLTCRKLTFCVQSKLCRPHLGRRLGADSGGAPGEGFRTKLLKRLLSGKKMESFCAGRRGGEQLEAEKGEALQRRLKGRRCADRVASLRNGLLWPSEFAEKAPARFLSVSTEGWRLSKGLCS